MTAPRVRIHARMLLGDHTQYLPIVHIIITIVLFADQVMFPAGTPPLGGSLEETFMIPAAPHDMRLTGPREEFFIIDTSFPAYNVDSAADTATLITLDIDSTLSSWCQGAFILYVHGACM